MQYRAYLAACGTLATPASEYPHTCRRNSITTTKTSALWIARIAMTLAPHQINASKNIGTAAAHVSRQRHDCDWSKLELILRCPIMTVAIDANAKLSSANQSRYLRNVTDGSKTAPTGSIRDFRFAPIYGHRRTGTSGPFRANNRDEAICAGFRPCYHAAGLPR